MAAVQDISANRGLRVKFDEGGEEQFVLYSEVFKESVLVTPHDSNTVEENPAMSPDIEAKLNDVCSNLGEGDIEDVERDEKNEMQDYHVNEIAKNYERGREDSPSESIKAGMTREDDKPRLSDQ